MLLGAIADDFTGATDLALSLTQAGMSVIQVIGAPDGTRGLPDTDALVVALKSRTIPAEAAVSDSLRAMEALLQAGARQIVFKYCSTFASPDHGNIGPVIDALMPRRGVELTLACPAFPANGRTVYHGHLFVGNQLLSDSPMRDHPLTPMRDPNLVTVLQRQSQQQVGWLPFAVVDRGPAAIKAALHEAAARGERILIVDALTEQHLCDIGTAGADLRLITGGSGIALGLAENFRRAGLLGRHPASRVRAPEGKRAIIAGSCSAATRNQVAVAVAAGLPAFRLEPEALASGDQSTEGVLAWAARQASDKPILVHSTSTPDEVAATHERLGRQAAASLLEASLATIARGLVDAGARRLIVAGGETSGAVVAALNVKALSIANEIDPGVPWTISLGEPPLALALKSGNFGTPNFFLKAWDALA